MKVVFTYNVIHSNQPHAECWDWDDEAHEFRKIMLAPLLPFLLWPYNNPNEWEPIAKDTCKKNGLNISQTLSYMHHARRLHVLCNERVHGRAACIFFLPSSAFQAVPVPLPGGPTATMKIRRKFQFVPIDANSASRMK